jgi:hypothetical protein
MKAPMSATRTPADLSIQSSQDPSDRRWIDEVEHPASHTRARRVPAGQAIATVLLALALAWLLNSESVLRKGEGMDPGVTRTVVLAVAGPVNSFAKMVGLATPRAALDAALGHQSYVAANTALETGSDDILNAPIPTPSASGPKQHHQAVTVLYPQDVGGITKIHPPTVSRPLRLLVTGDSLATYPGDQLANLSSAKVHVMVHSFNGTGLTTPGSFNWQLAAQNLVDDYHPDAVVMIMGANDGWDMKHDGQTLDWATPSWQHEYARRIAVVMQTFLRQGVDRVYYGGPPTAPASNYQRIFASINGAGEEAAAALPGARWVDLFNGTSSHGRYSRSEVYKGKRIDARQGDGLHWSYDGSLLPASLFLHALEREYGPLAKQ